MNQSTKPSRVDRQVARPSGVGASTQRAICRSPLPVVLLCAALGVGAARAEMVLAAGGRARIPVVAADAASRPAAAELAGYLGRLGGCPFEVVERADGPAVRVGDLAPAEVASESLGRDGFVLKQVGGDLVLAGATPLATSYAVTALLERLGCGWYFPGKLGEVVPAPVARLAVPELDELHRPSFRIRWVGSGDWARHNYANVGVGTPGEFKVKWFVHTWLSLVPPETYFAAHPEYYPLLGDQRVDPRQRYVQLCVSNPEVAAAAAKTIDQLLEQQPDLDMISVDPEDNQFFCQCPECLKLTDPEAPPERRHSRLVFTFTDRVAELVRRKHPNLILKTIAYWSYVAPPADPQWRPAPNVAVQYCRFMDHNHALADPRSTRNREYNAWYAAWLGHTPNVLFYEYYWKCSWLSLPWPIERSLCADLPRLHRDGVLGVATQYADNFATHGLGYWLAAHLLWDAGADVDALVKRYCDGLYGPASPAVQDYHRTLEQAAEESGLELAEQQPFNEVLQLFTPELLDKLDACVARAAAAADTPERRARVEGLRNGPVYARLLCDYLESVLLAGHCDLWPWPHMAKAPPYSMADAQRCADAVRAFVLQPDRQGWVGPLDDYLTGALKPEIAAGVLGRREVLTTPAWRHGRAPLAVPARVALWLYGNDFDRVHDVPEHRLFLRRRGGAWRQVGELAPLGVDGNERNLAVVIPGLALADFGPGPWELRIDNPPGGPFLSTLYAAWLLPDRGLVSVEEATRRVETGWPMLRAEAVAFVEGDRAGWACGEDRPCEIVLDR